MSNKRYQWPLRFKSCTSYPIKWVKGVQLLLPVVLSAICALGVIIGVQKDPLLNTWFGLIIDPSPEWYQKAYYNTVNLCHEEPSQYPDIILLDLNEKVTRKDLADLLITIAQGSPKAVGVDCIFSSSSTYDQDQTNYLVHTIAGLPDSIPIVFATSSLFQSSAIPDSVITYKGTVDFSGFFNFNAFVNDTPHFAIELARLTGADINKLDTVSFMVNYRCKDFLSVPIYSQFSQNKSYVDYIRNSVQNKIVIIGSTNNNFDMRQAPFTIGVEQYHISGSMLIAYYLTSVLSATTDTLKQNSNLSKYYHHYSRCPWWMNGLLTLFFVALYVLAYIYIEKLQQKRNWVVWLKPIWLFVMLLLIMRVSLFLTERFFYVPYVVLFMIMTAFIGFFYDQCTRIFSNMSK